MYMMDNARIQNKGKTARIKGLFSTTRINYYYFNITLYLNIHENIEQKILNIHMKIFTMKIGK